MNQMAALLNTSPPTYKKWEAGTVPLPLQAAHTLCSLTGTVTEMWLSDTAVLPDTITIGQGGEVPRTDKLNADPVAQREWLQFLGKLVNELGQTKKMNKAEIAELIGIDAGQLSRLVGGTKPLTRDMMFRIGSATGRYDWYKPATPNHQGEHLRDALEFFRIDQQTLADEMGQVKSTITPLLKKDTIKTSKWESLIRALRKLTGQFDLSKEIIMRGVVPVSGRLAAAQRDAAVSEDMATYAVDRRVRSLGNLSGEPVFELPFVPQRARAGISTPRYWEHPPETTRIMRASLIGLEADIFKPRRSWWVIEIDGDSMEPQLVTGSRVLAYYVGKEQATDLKPGVWAIQYDDDFVIKRVRTNQMENERGITLFSDNPPPDPYFIKADSVRHVWYIEKTIDSKVR